jgi:hypothetical protein
VSIPGWALVGAGAGPEQRHGLFNDLHGAGLIPLIPKPAFGNCKTHAAVVLVGDTVQNLPPDFSVPRDCVNGYHINLSWQDNVAIIVSNLTNSVPKIAMPVKGMIYRLNFILMAGAYGQVGTKMS